MSLTARARKLRFDFGRHFLPPSDLTRQTRHGLLTFSSRDAPIGRHLFAAGHWSWDLIESLMALLLREHLIAERDNDVFVNVGANIGSVLVPLMLTGRFRHGIGFEPAPANAAYLRRNITQNGLDPTVDSFELGLSDQPGTADFELSGTNMGDHRVRIGSSHHSAPDAYGESKRRVIQVALNSLDAFVAEHDIDLGRRPLFWVDVQGHEGYFLRGAARSLVPGCATVLELWPYGLERAGFQRGDFVALVQELFSDFYVEERGTWLKSSTDRFQETYAQYSHGTAGTDVVLVAR